MRARSSATRPTSQSFRVDALEYGVVDLPRRPARRRRPLPADGRPSRIPQTPDEVAAWLAGSHGYDRLAADRVLAVDGRDGARVRRHASARPATVGGEPPVSDTAFWFQAGEHHRVYAIPTAGDTILAVTWGGGFAGEGEEFLDTMNAATDDLVRSMTFE